jgi:WW domain
MENTTNNLQQQLPPGWVEAFDPNTGRIYYANATSGESSWNVPLPEHYQYESYHDLNYGEHDPIQDSTKRGQERYNSTTQSKSSEQTRISYLSSSTLATTTGEAERHSNINSFDENIGKSESIKCIINIAGMDTVDDEPSSNRIDDPIEHELSMISAGQIADFCYMQQQQQMHGHHHHDAASSASYIPYSTPISMTELSDKHTQRPMQEIGRLHTRYYTLREQMKQFSNAIV